MSIYCVSYDLFDGESEDYRNLIDHLKTYPRWWHHLQSTWFIETEQSAKEVLRNCARFVPTDIAIIVFEVGKTWAATGFERRGYQWLWNNWSTEEVES